MAIDDFLTDIAPSFLKFTNSVYSKSRPMVVGHANESYETVSKKSFPEKKRFSSVYLAHVKLSEDLVLSNVFGLATLKDEPNELL